MGRSTAAGRVAKFRILYSKQYQYPPGFTLLKCNERKSGNCRLLLKLFYEGQVYRVQLLELEGQLHWLLTPYLGGAFQLMAYSDFSFQTMVAAILEDSRAAIGSLEQI